MTKGIYYNYPSFKQAYDIWSHGKIGMFAYHAKFHDGHKQCALLAREKCDFVIGVFYQNFGAEQKKVLGKMYDNDKKFENSDLIPLHLYSDLAIVLKDDYFPALDHWNEIKKEFDKLFPEEYLKEKEIRNNLYASFLLSFSFRYTFHDIYKIHVDYCAQSGRDRWRTIGYTKWLWDRYKCFIDLRDPKRDELGNVISGMKNKLPKHLQDRIKKPLILPTFKCKEDVENHIKDIDGLHVDYFFREYGWIQVKFYFEEHQWWADGLKLEKDE